MLITEPQVPYNVEKTPAQSLLKEFLQAIVYGNKEFKIEMSCQCQNTIRKPTERLNLPETLQRVIHAKLDVSTPIMGTQGSCVQIQEKKNKHEKIEVAIAARM